MATTFDILTDPIEIDASTHAAVQSTFVIGALNFPPPLATPPEIQVVDNEGGEKITVTLTNVTDGQYNIHLGPLGTALDPIMYSGISGNGNTVTLTGGVFGAVTPPLPVGGPYRLTLVPLPSGITQVTEPAVTVIPHLMREKVFSMRRNLSPRWKLGSRRIVTERFPQ